MKNIKSFNEMRRSNIHTGIELTPKQINYIFDGIDKEYLKKFNILVDDNIYYVEYVNELWEFYKIQDVKDYIHLRYNIKNEDSNKVLEIIKRNKSLDFSYNYNWPIRWASYNGHIKLVRLLLQNPSVDPSDGDNLAIRWASYNGHDEIVKLLLTDSRVDPSVEDNHAIKSATMKRNIKIVKLLLADSRVNPSYAIKLAINKGYTEIVNILLQDDRVDYDRVDYDRDFLMTWRVKYLPFHN